MQNSRKIYKHDLTLEVGHVYVMTNEHIPDLIKIGMTTRTPEERSLELLSTGLPGRWNVEYSIFVPNCKKIEKTVHRVLNEHRLSDNREFFKIEISTAIETIESHAQTMISYFPGWPNLEMVSIFIEKELARIKDESAKRAERYRLEKQAWAIAIELESKQKQAEANQAIIDKKRTELEGVDFFTRRDINQSYFGWGLLPPTLCFIVSGVDKNERVVQLFFWVGALYLSLYIYSIWIEKKSAIKLRRARGLPEI